MSSFEVTGVPIDEIQTFLAGAHPDPFRLLGPHRTGDDLTVRVFRPDAKEVSIVLTRKEEQRFPAERLTREGFFQAVLPGRKRAPEYRIHLTGSDGSTAIVHDPYAYGPIMGEVDLHLFSEGNHLQIYEKFGAHLRTVGGVAGVYFAVWAPNAQRVSVVGDFNGWDGRTNPMRRLLGSGVWELFLPEIGEGVHYKFEIRTRGGHAVAQEPILSRFSISTGKDLFARLRSRPLSVERPRVDGGAAGPALADQPAQHLRSASRLLAAKG